MFFLFLLIIIFILSLIALVYLLNEEIKGISLRDKGPFFHLPACDLGQGIKIGEHNLKIFNNGGEAIHDMLSEIAKAKKYIFLESYIFRHDKIGKTFKRALAQKAKEGVAVYVIFDSLGNLWMPSYIWQRLKRSGAHVFEYGPIKTFRDYLRSKTWTRDHRKTLIIDGRIAYLGGLNIGREYEKRWRDTHLKIIGPAAGQVEKIFVDFWNAHKKKKIDFSPAIKEQEDIKIYFNEVVSRSYPIRPVYLDLIRQSKINLYLSFSYFVPDEEIMVEIEKAVLRGVGVEIIFPERSDVWIAHLALSSFVERLLRAGVKVYFYRRTMLHAKTMTADHDISIVGSANLDNRSLSKNYEIIALVKNKEFAQVMEKMFACDKNNCREVRIEEWVKRGKGRIFWENLSLLIRNFL